MIRMGYVSDEHILELLSTPPFDKYPEFKERLDVFREALTHVSHHDLAVKEKFGTVSVANLTSEEIKEHMMCCPSNGRLEHLGDAVLEYSTCYYLYCTSPAGAYDDFTTSLTPDKIRNVENSKLSDLFINEGLRRFILIDPSTEAERKTQVIVKNKLPANFVEALIGAAHVVGGLQCSMGLVYSWILDQEGPEPVPKHVTTSNEVHRHLVKSAMSLIDPLHFGCEMEEDVLDRFCEAFTFPSSHPIEPNLKDGYDLAFLGTSVLRLAQAEYFFNTRPYADKGRLTEIKQDVENLYKICKSMASSIRQRTGKELNLYDWIYTNNSDPTSYNNVLYNIKRKARLYKSIIGAYSVAYSFDETSKFIEETILKKIPEYDPSYKAGPEYNPSIATVINRHRSGDDLS